MTETNLLLIDLQKRLNELGAEKTRERNQGLVSAEMALGYMYAILDAVIVLDVEIRTSGGLV